MNVNGTAFRTVWMEDSAVCLIDQPGLPFAFTITRSATTAETARHIREMTVRGAPAIGAAAAYGMVQAVREKGADGLEWGAELLQATRPTARDLFNAVEYVVAACTAPVAGDIAAAARAAADAYTDRSVEECRQIGMQGAVLLSSGTRILTHCNAGWLATVDWGTALAPVYTAARAGTELFVYVDETRPRGQGARLTAWELANEAIPHAVIADNAAAYYMSRGEVDMVITGADRVAANGDTANKIGTLDKAVCARYFNIPFYIALPWSTLDLTCAAGRGIVIEEREGSEVSTSTGMGPDGSLAAVAVCNPSSPVKNPAFDVTPAELITGFITPDGIFKPEELGNCRRIRD